MAKTSTARRKKTTKKSTSKASRAAKTSQPVKVTKPEPTKKPKFTVESLNKWNLVMAGLLFVQGVAIVFLSRNITLPVTTSYLTRDTLASQAGSPVWAAATRNIADINLAYLLAAFLFISAAAYLIVATIYRQTYQENLEQGINKARWYQYGLTASLMLLTIALLSGVYDLSSLLMIVALTVVASLVGLVMELQKPVSWLSYGVSCLAGIVPWLVFAIYAVGTNLYGSGQIPNYIYAIYATIFFLFVCFGLNMFLQYKKVGKWADYLYVERVYMILSLVAKSALAWQVFFGALRP